MLSNGMKYRDPKRRSFDSAIAAVLCAAFDVVRTDRVRGSQFLAAKMEGLEPGSPEHDHFLRLFPETVEVIVTNNGLPEEQFARFVHTPTGQVFFTFNDDRHRRSAEDLMSQVVSLLGLVEETDA
jgi:hypothetical protein